MQLLRFQGRVNHQKRILKAAKNKRLKVAVVKTRTALYKKNTFYLSQIPWNRSLANLCFISKFRFFYLVNFLHLKMYKNTYCTMIDWGIFDGKYFSVGDIINLSSDHFLWIVITLWVNKIIDVSWVFTKQYRNICICKNCFFYKESFNMSWNVWK